MFSLTDTNHSCSALLTQTIRVQLLLHKPLIFNLTYTNHSCSALATQTFHVQPYKHKPFRHVQPYLRKLFMYVQLYLHKQFKCVQLYLHKPFVHVQTTHSCMFNLHKSFKHIQLDRRSHAMYLLQHQRMAQVLHKPDFPFDANTMFLLGLQTQNPENATMLNTIVLIMPCVNLFLCGFVHDIHLSTQTSFSY